MKRRAFAAIIDGFLFLVLVFILLSSTEYLDSLMIVLFKSKNYLSYHTNYMLILIFIYFFLIESVFFTSFGKWLFNMKIITTHYQKPERYLIFFRSLIRLFIMSTGIGIILLLIAFLFNYEPFMILYWA